MVRKQLYLDEAQDKALKRRAEELGVSEAEVVRRALHSALGPEAASRASERRQALLRLLFDEADQAAASHGFPVDYRFDRQALYEEDDRFERWNPRESLER